MANDTDKLLARADAALAEARQLTDLNEGWQELTADRLQRMFLRFSEFRAADRKSNYLQDFEEQLLPYRPFPTEDEPS